MNQYSINVFFVEAAMNLVEKLGLNVSAWQINYQRGVEDYKLSFRTDMELPEVQQLFLDYDRVHTLNQDF